ncbi:MAG: fructose-1,6-bisphosphatase/inositol monophosphatase family enzyme, partial [Planctomycetota bacterium]
RLEREESADVRNCYDDQYICSAGQLILLALGTYRFVVDPRAFLADRRGKPTITTKPYDIGGAILCAEAAGAVITATDGSSLDFPIDTHTPISFVGYANRATHLRLERHWLAVSSESVE